MYNVLKIMRLFPRQGEMNTNVTQQKVIYND